MAREGYTLPFTVIIFVIGIGWSYVHFRAIQTMEAVVWDQEGHAARRSTTPSADNSNEILGEDTYQGGDSMGSVPGAYFGVVEDEEAAEEEDRPGLVRVRIDVRNFKTGETEIVAQAFAELGTEVTAPPKELKAPLGSDVMDEWDVLWTSTRACKLSIAKGLRPHQKVNCMPGLQVIHKKDSLTDAMKAAYGSEVVAAILPRTYSLEKEHDQWRAALAASPPGFLWVLKKNVHLGNGIQLLRTAEALADDKYLPENREKLLLSRWRLAQQFIADPCLIHGRKFGLRVWGVITSANPVRVYVYDEALVLFSTVPYDSEAPAEDAPAGSWKKSKLTNAAQNAEGEVWRLSELQAWMSHKGDEEHCCDPVEAADGTGEGGMLWGRKGGCGRAYKEGIHAIHQAIGMAFLAALHSVRRESATVSSSSRALFQVLGFDFLFDSHLRPWLIEANATPSTSVRGDLMAAVKLQMLKDLGSLVGFLDASRFLDSTTATTTSTAAGSRSPDATDETPFNAARDDPTGRVDGGEPVAKLFSDKGKNKPIDSDAPDVSKQPGGAARPTGEAEETVGQAGCSQATGRDRGAQEGAGGQEGAGVVAGGGPTLPALPAALEWILQALEEEVTDAGSEIEPATSARVCDACNMREVRAAAVAAVAGMRRVMCSQGSDDVGFLHWVSGKVLGTRTGVACLTLHDLSVLLDAELEQAGRGAFVRVIPRSVREQPASVPVEASPGAGDGSPSHALPRHGPEHGCRPLTTSVTGSAPQGQHVPSSLDVGHWPHGIATDEDRLLWHWEWLMSASRLREDSDEGSPSSWCTSVRNGPSASGGIVSRGAAGIASPQKEHAHSKGHRHPCRTCVVPQVADLLVKLAACLGS
eukprot:jgi/Mesvir1/11782/Mv00149-RA.1